MSATALNRAAPLRRFDATSADGTRLAVQEWSPRRDDGRPTLVLVHAWSQSHLGWRPLFERDLLDAFHVISFDLRGHGESDAPGAIEAYLDGRRWAEDVNAVLDAAMVDRAVLVAWSLGGVVALDYLAAFGTDRIAGLQFVAAGNAIGVERAATHFGSAAAADAGPALGTDLAPRLEATLRLQQALVYREIPIEDFAELFAQALVASPVARAGLLSRQIDHDATLRSLTLPVRVAHGTEDAILTPQASRDVLERVPQAQVEWYEGGGHAPHWEDPARFRAALATFADSLRSSR